MKVKGLAEAIEEYKKLRFSSPFRGALMFNYMTGDLWVNLVTGEDISDCDDYDKSSNVNLGLLMTEDYVNKNWDSCDINEKNVRDYLKEKFMI